MNPGSITFNYLIFNYDITKAMNIGYIVKHKSEDLYLDATRKTNIISRNMISATIFYFKGTAQSIKDNQLIRALDVFNHLGLTNYKSNDFYVEKIVMYKHIDSSFVE